MKYLVPKDLRHRITFVRLERKRLLLKAITKNFLLSNEIRNIAQKQLSSLQKYGMSSKIRNRCILSGRARSVSRVFRLGRSMLHIMAGARQITWCQKIILVDKIICKIKLNDL